MIRLGAILLLAVIVSCGFVAKTLADSNPAFSGIATGSDSAMTAYLNPAGMTRLAKHGQWSVQVLGFYSESTFETNSGSFDPNAIEKNSGDAIVPFGYYARPINDDLWFGASLVVPGGMGENLDSTDPSRYLLDEWFIATVGFFPALGYRINDRWSIGAQLSVNYVLFNYQSAVLNFDPGFGDGRMELEADDVAFGGGFSAMYEPSNRTRIGFVYQSEIDANLSDTPTFSNIGPTRQMLLDNAGLLNQEIGMEWRFPQSIAVGLYHQKDSGVEVRFDALWAELSRLDMTQFSVGDNSIETEGMQLQDTIALTASLAFPYRDNVKLKIGAFYTGDLLEDEDRSMALRVDRILGIGAGFERRLQNKNVLSINLNYMDLGEAPVILDDVDGVGMVSGRFTKRWALALDLSYSKQF